MAIFEHGIDAFERQQPHDQNRDDDRCVHCGDEAHDRRIPQLAVMAVENAAYVGHCDDAVRLVLDVLREPVSR
ncbi:MAG: hypothetical protein ACLUFV_03080 [Acutalibacteraceae bacterium]